MSDRKSAANTPDSPSPVPTVRRISNPRPKKAPNKPAAAPPVEAETAAVAGGGDIEPIARVVEAVPSAAEEVLATTADWPEPEASTNGGQATADGKRKRRRRKGKGQSGNAQGASAKEESQAANEGAEQPPPGDLPKPLRAPQPPPRQQASRVKVDPEILARKAWRIFLAEVSEEGVALIGDQDARELARRCFRLAELFIEEQSRHFPGGA